MKALVSILFFLGSAASVAQTSVSFKFDIVPLLKRQCAACHITGQEVPGLALHPKGAYASLVGAKSAETDFLRVEPGNADDSYLVMKLEGTHIDRGGKGGRMPLGAPPLDAGTLHKIRDWINSGAPNN